MIHGLDRQGKERAVFDHGVQGRPAAGFDPVAFDPAKRLDIANPAFNSEDSSTWSYAPPERRVFGLAVHAGRLYYAVADGMQVWSVAIAAYIFVRFPIRASRFRPRRAPPATRSPRSRSTIRAGCCSRNAPRPPALTISPR